MHLHERLAGEILNLIDARFQFSVDQDRRGHVGGIAGGNVRRVDHGWSSLSHPAHTNHNKISSV